MKRTGGWVVMAALALALAGCEGATGPQGDPGEAGAGCTVADNGDGTKTITCGQTTVSVTDGASCQAVDNRDGTKTITCGQTTVTIADGAKGDPGEAGTSCTVEDNGDGTKTITCGETTVTIADGAKGDPGEAGTSCTVEDNGDGTKTITCGETTVTIADGANGEPGAPGANAPTTGKVKGTVVDVGGAPVGGVDITLNPGPGAVQSDEAGTFEVVDVPIGAHSLTAVKAGVGSAALMVGVAGNVTTTVAILLVPDASTTSVIGGHVVDVQGNGIAGVTVTAEGQDASVVTAADGSFLLEGVVPGFVYLQATPGDETHLPGETRHSIFVPAGTVVSGIDIVLSGRPSAAATYVGGARCAACHAGIHPDIVQGAANAAHARFVVEGTSNMVYPELWPAPGDKFLPRDPKGVLLKVQDPLDGQGLVHLVLCTEDTAAGRRYLFKFYPEQPAGVVLGEDDLDCSAGPAEAIWIPVAATIGGQGNWGEGHADPAHAVPDTHPNFGEGKQRFMARVEDVPYVKKWMEDHGIPVNRAKPDYIDFLPVYIMQDGTPTGDGALEAGEVGVPKFWQKSPTAWCGPDNTLSRNCSGCHATGLRIAYRDVTDGATTRKAIITEFDYKDLNITCERCHGPGSEHATTTNPGKIITPQNLTARSANELCGQCHATHDGKSATPKGVFKMPFDETYLGTLGNGVFVPGVYDLATFLYNYNQPSTTANWSEGPFHTWPDQTHGRAHSMELPELLRSAHTNNPYQKVTCSDCHDPHSLKLPAVSAGGLDFGAAGYEDNVLCLTCHASHGPFEGISVGDLAAVQIDSGRPVSQGGTAVTLSANDRALALTRIGKAVGRHMQTEAGMGVALYTPANDASPIGRCTTCHMPKTGKLQDVNDDAQYHLALDADGQSAVAEGNVPSHVFDIVWPAQSAVLKNPNPATAHDYDIMPNSCGKCHAAARFSGD
ncbi:MAG TPA: cytochrome c3 family protein [Myxococcota bacterium]|nr:cytochrome c3 family protein [Myxococcota bacterium]